MRAFRMTAAAVTAAALAIAPMAIAVAAPPSTPPGKPTATPTKPVTPAKPKPKFAVTALQVMGAGKTFDVKEAGISVRVRVQVKDFDKKFDPTSVKVAYVVTKADTSKVTTTVEAKRIGKSKVVSNWQARIAVSKGAVPPQETWKYCVTLVKTSDGSVVGPVATAKGLAGKDCFFVKNSAPKP